MSDIGSQLRDYIDGIATPVTQDERVPIQELGAAHPRRGPRRRPAIFAIAALLLTVLVVSAALLLRSHGRTVSTGSRPAIALVPKGDARCSFAESAISPRAAVLVAVRILDHHTLCISQNPGYESIRTFFDDAEHSVSVGVSHLSTGLNFFGIDGRFRGLPVFVGTLPEPARAARLTFCDGRSVDVPALNSGPQRFFAAAIDTQRYGTPSIQGLDADGRQASGSYGPLSGTGPSGKSCNVDR
jgi:hypothetical protein